MINQITISPSYDIWLHFTSGEKMTGQDKKDIYALAGSDK